MSIEKELTQAAQHGFIDNRIEAADVYQPRLVTNQHDDTVLAAIEDELRDCKSFTIAVAFVTLGGLIDLKPVLADMALHGIRGRLVTSTYLSFNQPAVFSDLLHIPNLDVRVLDQDGFHTKAYYFQHANYESVLIGSANLTQNALKVNFEWNLRVTSTERGDVVREVKQNLKELWDQATPLTPAWIEGYAKHWPPAPQRAEAVAEQARDYLKPNLMQRNALATIAELREQKHAKRALVVAATGTGKTILAALDVQRFKPRKMLYVVHREQILRKAMASFKQIIGGPDKDYGILSGSEHDTEAKYLFATVNMAAKPAICQELGRDAFDYILIDEAHRVGENAPGEKETMYQRLMGFYQPKFMLGMTATPDRMDSTNVYEFFDYNLAYEISLLDALDDQLLVPFHYIGVPDYQKNGLTITDSTTLKDLVSDERVDYLISKTYYYGPREGGVHGLIFVSRVDEGRKLADKLRERGIGATFVSGSDSITAREAAVRDLEQGRIQYIVIVDIFNEGVDIPILNQVVMMRPTQSSIIFLQQLGRGLRKAEGKEFLTVLDFIGNYKENYMIPMAFDKAHRSNKERIRQEVIAPTISGVSTISFEEVARKNVLRTISQAKLGALSRLKQDYYVLQAKIGRKPMLMDFAKLGSVSYIDIVTFQKTVYDLQRKSEPKNLPKPLSDRQYKFLLFLSMEIAVARRPIEAWVLQQLMAGSKLTSANILVAIQARGWFCDEETLHSVGRVLERKYHTLGVSLKRYGSLPLVQIRQGSWVLAPDFAEDLADENFRPYAEDAVAVNLFELQNGPYDLQNRFTIGEKYFRKDVIRMLNWETEQNGQNVGGYMMRSDKRFIPVFIALEKTDKFSSKMAYEDEFIDHSTMRWYSKSGRKTDSRVEQILINNHDWDMIHLFVKKSDHDKGEGNDFYYLGSAKVTTSENVVRLNAEGKATNLVRFRLNLQHSVNSGLYRALNDFEE